MTAVHQGEPSKLAIFAMVVRRSGPHLIEATIVPAVLFYVCLLAAGLGAAHIAALSWSYAALARRVVGRDPVPAILAIGAIRIPVRTLVAVPHPRSLVELVPPPRGPPVPDAVLPDSAAHRPHP